MLINKLPTYYKNSEVMNSIINAQESEIAKIDDACDKMGKQMIVTTATHLLSRYESDLGIPIHESVPLEVRRNRILSKRRGLGTITTVELLRIIHTYVDGIVTISERYSEYTVNIKFITVKGVPEAIDDIKKAIEEVIPAHIKVIYEYSYRTWDEIKTIVGTWDDVSNYTWDGVASVQPQLNMLINNNNDVFYQPLNDGNAILTYDENGIPYATKEGE